MKTSPLATIDKFAVLPESQDFNILRKLGVTHIEKMAAKLWTDYNVHDPGITTLEMLCYAITDLGYRTAYPVEDILAEKTIGQHTDNLNFYTARQIMPCSPVTFNDFRALSLFTTRFSALCRTTQLLMRIRSASLA